MAMASNLIDTSDSTAGKKLLERIRDLPFPLATRQPYGIPKPCLRTPTVSLALSLNEP